MTIAEPHDRPATANLGCGRKILANAVNVDRVPGPGVDVVHDLDVVPWPFADRSFDEIIAHDVLEHVADAVTAMEEIHRIARPSALVRITVPHYSSPNAFTDPTHRRAFGYFSFDYFTGVETLPSYTKARFSRRRISLIFAPTLVNKLVRRLASRFPAEYERRWSWMFPAWFLYAELEVLKDRL